MGVTWERGFNKLILETDSMIIMKLINHGEDVMWEGDTLVFDILNYATSHVNCDFIHV